MSWVLLTDHTDKGVVYRADCITSYTKPMYIHWVVDGVQVNSSEEFELLSPVQCDQTCNSSLLVHGRKNETKTLSCVAFLGSVELNSSITLEGIGL